MKKYFTEMQTNEALILTSLYHIEESRLIEGVLDQWNKKELIENFIAIGSARLRYMDIALRFCKSYTCVDLHLSHYLKARKMNSILQFTKNIHLVNKCFSKVKKENLPQGQKVFFFLFNVYPYISHALETMQGLIEKGDIIVISSWNGDSKKALSMKKKYYEYLNEFCEDKRSTFNFPRLYYVNDLEKEFKKLKAKTRRYKNDITDILTIQVK